MLDAPPGRVCRTAAAALVLLAACGPNGSPRPAPGTSAAPRLEGRVLSDDGRPDGVVETVFPEGASRPLRVPANADFVPVVAPYEEGAAALVYRGSRAGVYHLRPDREPETLLAGLTDVVGVDVAGGSVVVGDCGARELVVVGEGEPVRVPGSCNGTLSPDGSLAVFVADDGVVYRVPVDGSSEPLRLFALDEVPGLAAAVPTSERSVFRVTWGEPGLALSVGTGDDNAVVVALTTGRLRTIETPGAAFVTFLEWQPGGSLLGIGTGQTGNEGIMRIFDAVGEELRTIAAHPRGFVSATWSPDGRSVLAATGAGFFGSGGGFWILVDLEGRQVDRLRGPGGLIHGWVS